MSTGVKAAAFAAFVRVFLSPLEPLKDQWIPVLVVIAAATMILGTVVGVVQTNIKRMLAYSSIAHAGYLMLGLIATTNTGKAAVLFYLLAYAVSNLGALGIVALLGTLSTGTTSCSDFAGLSKARPALAALMTVFLLSLGGFPPMAGFIGKWYIFSAAVERGHYWLAIIGVLTSVVSVFFYLRIVVMMYMTEGSRHRASARAARRPGRTRAGDRGGALSRRCCRRRSSTWRSIRLRRFSRPCSALCSVGSPASAGSLLNEVELTSRKQAPKPRMRGQLIVFRRDRPQIQHDTIVARCAR